MTEAVVRHSLKQTILATASTPTEAVYEFWVPRTNERADVAVIGDAIEAFEIKTERDTLKRLPRQAEAYARLFDRCHAVLAARHVDSAVDMLPPWWGVLVYRDDGEPSFEVLRDAAINVDVDAETLVRLLWRDEAHAALCALGSPPDLRAGRPRMWDLLLTLLDLEDLKAVVRRTLLHRDPRQARIPSRRFSVS